MTTTDERAHILQARQGGKWTTATADVNRWTAYRLMSEMVAGGLDASTLRVVETARRLPQVSR